MVVDNESETPNLRGEYSSSPSQAFRFLAHPYRKIVKRTAPSPADRRHRGAIGRNFPRVGRNQLRVRRILIIAGRPLSTTEIARRIFARPIYSQVNNVYRAARKFAERVGYRASRGKPVLWRLKHRAYDY